MRRWRQSACHQKTKRKPLYYVKFLALSRPCALSFRRSGETEMEQLFQMATMRAPGKVNRDIIAE
jgi:hypothetical protein